MNRVVPKLRALFFATAILIVVGGMVLPAYTTDKAPAPLGPCSDEGCFGGPDLCDYVELGGQWLPCNQPGGGGTIGQQ